MSLLSLSRTDSNRPRTLSLECYASVLAHISRLRPDRSSDQDNVWYSKVTTTLAIKARCVGKGGGRVVKAVRPLIPWEAIVLPLKYSFVAPTFSLNKGCVWLA